MTRRSQTVDARFVGIAVMAKQPRAVYSEYDADAAPLVVLLERHVEQSKPGGDPAVARELAARFDTEFEKLCAKWFRSGASHFVRHRADDEARMGQRAWLGDGTTPFERSPVDL
jgi:hypothetical protein